MNSAKSITVWSLIPFLVIAMISCDSDFYEKGNIDQVMSAPTSGQSPGSIESELRGIISIIEDLEAQDILNHGRANALIVAIENAITSLSNDRTHVGIWQLQNFNNLIDNFSRTGDIPVDEGIALTSSVDIFILLLESGITNHDGLLAFYPLNGNALDYSGNANHGIMYGNITPIPGRNGGELGSLYFDGLNDYIDLPNPYTYDRFTVNAWANPEANNPDGLCRIVDAWRDGEMFALSYGYFDMDPPTSPGVWVGYEGPGFYVFGSVHVWMNDQYMYRERHFFKKLTDLEGWHMVTLTYEYPNARLYFDGQLVSEIDASALGSSYKIRSRVNIPLIDIEIGRNRRNRLYKGSMDDISFFSVALDETTIAQLYSSSGP